MDLVSSIRKTGSRGGVNFNWEDVASSNHRENYLGHSLKAPVGRWAKGRDLTWYANSDATGASATETEQEREARERKEELKRIKEAEEDALARALGLPIAPRKGADANATVKEEVWRKAAIPSPPLEMKANQLIRTGSHRGDMTIPKDAIEGDTEAEVTAERDIGTGLQGEGMNLASIGQVMIEMTDIVIEDEGAIAPSGMSIDTEEVIGETVAARAALRDLSGEGKARKAIGLDREMDDHTEVEVPGNIEGEALQATLVDDFCHLSFHRHPTSVNVTRNGYSPFYAVVSNVAAVT
ncbi:hypothetical protein Hte_006163 [Hypoxylon texense]